MVLDCWRLGFVSRIFFFRVCSVSGGARLLLDGEIDLLS